MWRQLNLFPVAAVLRGDNRQSHHCCFQSVAWKNWAAKNHSGLVLFNIKEFIGLFEDVCNTKYNYEKVLWRDLVCIFSSMLVCFF